MPHEAVRIGVAVAALTVVWLTLAGVPVVAGDEQAEHSLAAVLHTVFERHPALRVAGYDAAIADAELARAESALDPVLGLRLGVADDRSPVLSGFQPAESRSAAFTGSLNQSLSGGGALGVTVDYSRTRQQFDSPFAAQLALLNPAYRGGVAVNYRHPLFRGAGRVDYHETLTVAATGVDAAHLQHQTLTQALALQTLASYFRLLADEVGIHLAVDSLERAHRLVEHQRFREEFGLIEAADRMQSEALLAARALDLQRARAQARADRVELNRLMLRDADAALQPVVPHGEIKTPRLEEAMRQALASRPELKLLERELDIAEARIRMARESTRPQFDLIVEAGAFALDREPLDAFAIDPRDRFFSLSVELRDTLGRRGAHAGLLAAELERERLIARRQQVSEQLRDELSALDVTLISGEETLRLSVQRSVAERRKFEAEFERYRDGRSDSATLIQFEGELAAAERDAELQRLALLLAEYQHAWARGILLSVLGIDTVDGTIP